MKTAISLSDETFERASRRAQELGMSRSEFFARAADHYLLALDAFLLPQQIDAALRHVGPMEDSATVAVEAGHAALGGGDDW